MAKSPARNPWMTIGFAAAALVAATWLAYPALYESLAIPRRFRRAAVEKRYGPHLAALRRLAASDDPMLGATDLAIGRLDWDRPELRAARIWYSDGTAGFIKGPMRWDTTTIRPADVWARLYAWRSNSTDGVMRMAADAPGGARDLVFFAESWSRGTHGFFLLFDPDPAPAGTSGPPPGSTHTFVLPGAVAEENAASGQAEPTRAGDAVEDAPRPGASGASPPGDGDPPSDETPPKGPTP